MEGTDFCSSLTRSVPFVTLTSCLIVHISFPSSKADQTVVPKESSLFGVFHASTQSVVPLRDQAMYKEDWIGLRSLDEQGKLMMDELEGGHMDIDWSFFNETVPSLPPSLPPSLSLSLSLS